MLRKLEEQMNPDPMIQFLEWYDEATQAQVKNPDAMTLATATRSGIPSARIVLFKGMNKKGIRFFTNFQSRKGKELRSNPRAALVFYWPEVNRQIRVEGKIKKVTQLESDQYWQLRPLESRLGALASQQSAVISSREEMIQTFERLKKKFTGKEIPRPSHWGGFCLLPHRIEFWTEGENRLHDRFCYIHKKNQWELYRLSP